MYQSVQLEQARNCNIIIFHEDGTPQEEGSEEEDMEVQDIIAIYPHHFMENNYRLN